MLYISQIKLRNFKSFSAVNVPLPRSFLCLAGPNGSGKCVDGDTNILLADGTTTRIRDLVNEALDQGHVDKIDDGFIAQYDSSKEILCLDRKTLKVIKRRIAAFVKRATPSKMLKVRTRSGKEIIATKYHPFFILKNEKITPIRADELKEKIRIAIPRNITIKNSENIFLELIDEISEEDNIYVQYSEEIARIVSSKKINLTWNDLNQRIGIPQKTLECFINLKQAILFPYIVRALKFCGLNNFEISQLIRHVKGDGGGQIVKMPWQNSNKFCRFLGYMLAEGSVSKSNNQVRLTNSSKEIINDFVSIAKDLFGLEAKVHKYKSVAYGIIINSVVLRSLLLKFGMSYGGAGEKYISELILRYSTSEQLSNLLNGLYSGDGYVSKSSIEITLKSEKLIRKINQIFLRFGLIGRIKKITKRETKTGFVGEYYKLSLNGEESFRIFNQNIKITHKMKEERVNKLIGKTINPNVDLIEANSILKKAVKELQINVKENKKDFPRLDSYCYNQCTPSRYGLNKLMNKILIPKAAQQQIQSTSMEKMEILLNSDIFWDEIEEIETVAPKEDWVYDLTISEDHNFIANEIFIHNSNITDSIRFALGETSLKSLRAKKVKDLIHTGAQTAEVTIYFDGIKKYEVKRAIRNDGKILYKFNGKKTTRTAILDELKKHNLDDSGRNVIAQGAVQRIIDMNGKERRGIIESVAGISDFDYKKNESLKELETVDTRIREASLVLGEREAFLNELGKERDAAISYLENKKKLTNSRVSLITHETKRMGSELEDVLVKDQKIKHAIAIKEDDVKETDEKILEIEKNRSETSKELSLRQQTNALIKKLEELKSSTSSKTQMIADKEMFLKRISEESTSLEGQFKEDILEIEKIEKHLLQINEELKLAEVGKKQFADTKELALVEEMKKEINEIEKELAITKENIIRFIAEEKSNETIIETKTSQMQSLAEMAGEAEKNDKLNDELLVLRGVTKDIAKELEDCFKEVKNENLEISETDRQILELKEKASLLRIRASPAAANPALNYIKTLKDKNEIYGIYGNIAELITFEPKYAQAIEAAGGGRLLYTIVQDIDVATQIIKRLKDQRLGRATFIPLKEVKTRPGVDNKSAPSLVKFIKYPEEIRKAIEFCFGDTLLVDNMAEAKRLGIGSARIVTLEGEIVEQSGVVSGGKNENSVLIASQLKKLDDQIKDVKEVKETIIKSIYEMRERESALRSRKTETEIRIKTIELELNMGKEQSQKLENEIKKRVEIASEIEELKKQMKRKELQKQIDQKKVSELEQKVHVKKQKLVELELNIKHTEGETQKKRLELFSRISSLEATIEGKKKELEIRKGEQHAKEQKVKQLEKEKKEVNSTITELKRAIFNDSEELKKTEENISKYSKEIEKLFGVLKEYETQLQNYGKIRAEKRIELDKLSKENNEVSIKKATLETRLADLKSELLSYKEYELLELDKEELTKMIKEAEEILGSLGNVNLAAIDLFGKKQDEIKDAKERIGILNQEREAIMTMISEIEERKKDAFFETFHAVNDNLKRMFNHINIGEGYLYLDKPNEPFDSGLHIRLKRRGIEHVLDSLSGGESTIVALMFIFALQFFKPSPFYILDEVDAALDKENSQNLARLIAQMSKDTQFLVVSHNDMVMSNAEVILGVTKVNGVSKLVGVKLEQAQNLVASEVPIN